MTPPIPIKQLVGLADRTLIHCFTGEVMYVNDPKQGQYGQMQSLKVKDPAGDQIYIRFSKCPTMGQDLKGKTITLTPGSTAKGLAGLMVTSYMKDGARIVQIDANSSAKLFIGAPDQAGFATETRPQQSYSTPPPPAGPRMPRAIDDDSLKAYFDRYRETYLKVKALNEASGGAIPEENLQQLTTHLILEFR
jgi:hypothetical protein